MCKVYVHNDLSDVRLNKMQTYTKKIWLGVQTPLVLIENKTDTNKMLYQIYQH